MPPHLVKRPGRKNWYISDSEHLESTWTPLKGRAKEVLNNYDRQRLGILKLPNKRISCFKEAYLKHAAKINKKATIVHSAGEYVRGNVHTQNIDSFWSLLKRGIVGTYHKVSKEYLPLYMNEFSYRFNNRKNPDAFSNLVTTCSK